MERDNMMNSMACRRPKPDATYKFEHVERLPAEVTLNVMNFTTLNKG